VQVGNTSVMRIIVEDTSVATDTISPCGTYPVGETQDYSIRFNQATNDIAIAGIVAPAATNNCANNSQYLVVAIRNNGTAAQSNIPITATVLNGTATVASFNTTYPGTIVAGGIENYVFQKPFASVGGNTYTITVSANLPSDQNTSNNTQTANITIAGTAAPAATGEICGTSTAYLNVANPNSSSNYLWYQTSSSATPFAAGDSITTSVTTSNNTYYLQSGSNTSAGPLNKAVYGKGGYNSYHGNYVNYTSTVPINLNIAKLYTGYKGQITFIVADISNVQSNGSFSYLPYYSNTIDVYPTDTPRVTTYTNGSPNENSNDLSDSGSYYYLNLPLPAGNHSIIVICSDSTNIFRNDSITANPYPVGIPGIFTITGNSAGTTANPNGYQPYYYFFYDMKLSTNDCMSAMTPIVATSAPTPTISPSGANLTSSVANAKSYQWYLNGTAINSATTNSVYPTTQGNYTVNVTDLLGCSLTSAAYNFTVTAVNNVNNNDIGLKVSPNPSTGSFNVSFSLQNTSNVDIELISITGQIITDKHYSALTGIFSETFNSGNVAPGTYILKVQTDSNVYWTKVMIER
jgi:hypothetical protein